jgi:protein arginine kinase
MSTPNILGSHKWIETVGPYIDIVVSTRSRYARNIMGVTFAPYAKPDELAKIVDIVDDAVSSQRVLGSNDRLVIADMPRLERRYLKESRIISAELEKGGQHRIVYLNPDRTKSLMVNEEDHIRMQCILAGFQLHPTLQAIDKIDNRLELSIPYAFSERFGYLATCPTNTGTGLRVSVMMHLPGLALSQVIDKILSLVQPYGLTIRGFYGEHSEYVGDFYQISNEVTLGKSEEEIVEIMDKVVTQIVTKEQHAREQLFAQRRNAIDDAIWRSYAVLSNARMIDSSEAMKLLSRVRLGIDRGYFTSFTHSELNKLIIEIQPAHLELTGEGDGGSEARDIARAAFLRKRFQGLVSHN